MKSIVILGLSLTMAVVMGIACKPCPESKPCRDQGAPPPPLAKSQSAAMLVHNHEPASDQTCNPKWYCDVQGKWPACQEAELPDSDVQSSGVKRCEKEFRSLGTVTADELSYPQCEVVCKNNSKRDTQLCDDPVRCVGLPECGPSVDPKRCCDKTVDQVDIDRRYLDFMWRMFISINIHRPEQAQPDWLTWTAPFVASPEAESLLPKNVERAKSSVRSGLTCVDREVPDVFLHVPWNDDEPPAATPSPHSNPISYTAPDTKSAYVQFRTSTSRESPNAHSGLLKNACRQALQAASWFRLDEVGWWQGDHEDTIGPVHLKAAWIRVPETECGKEFICGKPDNGPLQGLVALHVVAKNNHSESFWTWATFEHIRAVDADGDLPALLSGAGEPNKCPDKGEPTNVDRVQLDYPGAADYRRLVDEINQAAIRTLKREATGTNGLGVLARYQLRGVQRPRTDGDKIIAWPPKLSNAVIEWDHQDSSCMGCHSRALSWRLCAPGESDCELCKTDCPSVKLDWVPQRARQRMVPQSDMFWGYSRANPQ